MICLDDPVSKRIITETASKNNISEEKVRSVVEAYYESIVSIIQEDKPVEIKLDFFGKIRAKKSYAEIAEKIKKKFSNLKKVEEVNIHTEYDEVL